MHVYATHYYSSVRPDSHGRSLNDRPTGLHDPSRPLTIHGRGRPGRRMTGEVERTHFLEEYHQTQVFIQQKLFARVSPCIAMLVWRPFWSHWRILCSVSYS